MSHEYVGNNNLKDKCNLLKDSILKLYNKETNLNEFRKIFENLNLVVDDGQYDVFILNKKSNIGLEKSAEELALHTILISDLYYENLRDKPEILKNTSLSIELSSTALKEDVYKILKDYKDNNKYIKSLPKDTLIGNLKKTMLRNDYEKFESDIYKKFNQYGVNITAEFYKSIIKSSKNIDKYPIEVFVNLNNLVSRIIFENQIIDNLQKKIEIKDIQIDKKNKNKGILLA